MAVETVISLAAAIAMLDALTALLDAGAGAGNVEIRSGTKPSSPEDAPSDGAVLADITLNDPAFVGAVDGTPGLYAKALADVSPAISDASADATGTASWFRAYDSNGVARIDGTVATATADMIVNTVSLVAASPFTIQSWEIRMPTGET